MTAQAQVTPPVAEGSIVLLSGFTLGSDDISIEGTMRAMAESIEEAVGHRQFCLLWTSDDADVEVWGPDVDLKARITELLAKTQEGTP